MAPKAPVEEEERDFTIYADKAPTNTMQAFADWLIDVVGLEFKTKAAEQEFRDGVRLGGTLRMEFQASDFWKEHDLNPRAPQNASNGSKPAAKGRGKAKAQTEDEDGDEGTEDEAPAKATTRATGRRGTAAKGTTAKAGAKTTTRGKPAARGRRGAAAAASTGEAPY